MVGEVLKKRNRRQVTQMWEVEVGKKEFSA